MGCAVVTENDSKCLLISHGCVRGLTLAGPGAWFPSGAMQRFGEDGSQIQPAAGSGLGLYIIAERSALRGCFGGFK